MSNIYKGAWMDLTLGDSHYEYQIDDHCLVLRAKGSDKSVHINPRILPILQNIVNDFLVEKFK